MQCATSTFSAPVSYAKRCLFEEGNKSHLNFPISKIPLILFFPQDFTWFLLNQVLAIKYLLQSCQRTASQKDLGVGDGAALSPPVGRELASFPPACAPIPAAHCTTTGMHNSTLLQLCFALFYQSHLCLLSHATLGAAAFHQNFTPILTITQLVSVRSNHSESENHDRLLLIKLLRVRCKLQEREFE